MFWNFSLAGGMINNQWWIHRYQRPMHWRWGKKADYIYLFKKYLLRTFYVPDTWDTLMSRHKILDNMEFTI